MHLATDLAQIPLVADQPLARRRGGDRRSPSIPQDRRFADPAWESNPAYYSVRLAYLAASRFARDVVGVGAELEADAAQKASLALDLLLDSLAPTNFLATNPAALQRAFQTSGGSLVKGAQHFVDDLVNNGGRPRQVDTSGFTSARTSPARRRRWCTATS